MVEGGGAEGCSQNFALLLHLAARMALGEVKRWKLLMNHTKSYNPVPRLSRHTVPTNLTP